MKPCPNCGYCDLSEAQREVITTIAKEKRALYQSELAVMLNKTQAAIWKNVHPLIEQGILTATQYHRGGAIFLTLGPKSRKYITA